MCVLNLLHIVLFCCLWLCLQLGHMPQEDYPEALHDIMLAFLTGESDDWAPGKQVKMTKKGMMDA
jgi:hypothetical protein